MYGLIFPKDWKVKNSKQMVNIECIILRPEGIYDCQYRLAKVNKQVEAS